ncbi:AraC family transcriptional regulator [Cohnella sp. JJ-181]|uniref:AraC family transcriptional regulator n=1 Tax=Cohnella rhizoplanae TaxID=2974897 RepID=UPI0022FF7021|nr:AraC family transcriptional regulator [Cohnella sp. JJ-181]CAI6035334.1 Arabinose operon regulatory protein [Cohnella sp. JJ-181]
MNRIVPLSLGPDAFFSSYRQTTNDSDWLAYHAHQGIEMLYVHQGRGEATTEDARYPIRPGALLLFPPYQLHKIDVPSVPGTPYIRSLVKFDPRIVEPYLAPYPGLARWFQKLKRGLLSRSYFELGAEARLPGMLQDFHALYAAPGPDKEEQRSLFLVSLLHELRHRVFPPDSRTGSPEGEGHSLHIDRIMDWLEARYARPFDLQALSGDLHLSPYYLSHLFKEHTGSSIRDYITARRIREACRLLSATSDPISSIAEQVGGFGASHFCQLFKKSKGMSPEAFRRTVQQGFTAAP